MDTSRLLHHHQEIMESESLESMLVCTNIKQQTEAETKTQRQGGQGQKQQEKKPRPTEEALKCPRCESTNTKFCYYNNYSLSQPRYFCKSCKKYWTQGGTLRNIPVGGGCRKNRRISSTSSSRRATPDHHHPHHLITTTQTPTTSDPLSSSYENNTNTDITNGIDLLGVNENSHFTLMGNSFLDGGLGLGLHPLCFGELDNFSENGRGNSVNFNNNFQYHQEMNMMSNTRSSLTRMINHDLDENKLFWGFPWQITGADHHNHHYHHHGGNYMNFNAIPAGNHEINCNTTTGVVGPS